MDSKGTKTPPSSRRKVSDDVLFLQGPRMLRMLLEAGPAGMCSSFIDDKLATTNGTATAVARRLESVLEVGPGAGIRKGRSWREYPPWRHIGGRSPRTVSVRRPPSYKEGAGQQVEGSVGPCRTRRVP